ncbi:hypothetical protein SprV_0501765500 [Sparganum proliferum]
MPATAPTPHCSLLTGSDGGCGVGMGRESEVDDSAHFPHYKQSDVLEAITVTDQSNSMQPCESFCSKEVPIGEIKQNPVSLVEARLIHLQQVKNTTNPWKTVLETILSIQRRHGSVFVWEDSNIRKLSFGYQKQESQAVKGIQTENGAPHSPIYGSVCIRSGRRCLGYMSHAV